MTGNKEGAKKGAETQKAAAKERLKEAEHNALGRNPDHPGVPSEAWAKKNGLK